MKHNPVHHANDAAFYKQHDYAIADKWQHVASCANFDFTSRFLYYWIAFGSLVDELSSSSDISCFRHRFHEQLVHIVSNDSDNRVEYGLWETYTNTVRLILDSRYTFKPYWDYEKGLITKQEWVMALRRNNRTALRALERRDAAILVIIVFDRIYTLRNQLLHGAFLPEDATCAIELRSATQVMSVLLPVFTSILKSVELSSENTNSEHMNSKTYTH